MKKITYFLVFVGVLFSVEQVVENYSNGTPEIIKTYSSGYGKLDLSKEIGYYSDGSKKYQKTYYNGKVKTEQRWDKDGNKINLSDYKVEEDEVEKKEKKIDLLKQKQNKLSELVRIQGHNLIYQEFKLDSLVLSLEQMQFEMAKMNRQLTEKDEQLEEDTEENADGLSSLKRSAARDFRKIKKEASNLKSDLNETKNYIKKMDSK